MRLMRTVIVWVVMGLSAAMAVFTWSAGDGWLVMKLRGISWAHRIPAMEHDGWYSAAVDQGRVIIEPGMTRYSLSERLDAARRKRGEPLDFSTPAIEVEIWRRGGPDKESGLFWNCERRTSGAAYWEDWGGISIARPEIIGELYETIEREDPRFWRIIGHRLAEQPVELHFLPGAGRADWYPSGAAQVSVRVRSVDSLAVGLDVLTYVSMGVMVSGGVVLVVRVVRGGKANAGAETS